MGHTLSQKMLKAVDESQKTLENVFRTMKLHRKPPEEQAQKPQVQEAITARPAPAGETLSQQAKNTRTQLDSLLRARWAKRSDS